MRDSVCFTTGGSDARRYCVPVGTRLVMFGDSTMRYSYLALAFALAHGREHTHDWPNRSIVNERSFARDAGVPNGNWRPFYESTNSMLRPGIEHCDCYRGSTCCSSPMSENRYFSHRNVSITYIQSGPGGARVPTYGAWWPGQPDSLRKPHLRSPSPPYNTNTSKFWRLSFPELVATLLPLLKPTEVILHQSVAPRSRRAPMSPLYTSPIAFNLASRCTTEIHIHTPLCVPLQFVRAARLVESSAANTPPDLVEDGACKGQRDYNEQIRAQRRSTQCRAASARRGRRGRGGQTL